eukprot:6461567-Amphidinium_carterae.1
MEDEASKQTNTFAKGRTLISTTPRGFSEAADLQWELLETQSCLCRQVSAPCNMMFTMKHRAENCSTQCASPILARNMRGSLIVETINLLPLGHYLGTCPTLQRTNLASKTLDATSAGIGKELRVTSGSPGS